ncbi:nucleotidyl transferase AbiEii/AbiGii toxin family protein [Tomitella cavernea]|uniref:Nucleotidyl transferase AbiEii/AbiGii toxin family protein n=1 Tax=Tomitella cavernea TaxID=1387982 RepID=A0ABP9C4K9_9ACTN|nr:nucleotidyl transferase AbiEii/AbiGii toxin family protein [Tomitella cavernea]
MTSAAQPPARNAAAFSRSLKDHIRNEAKRRGGDTGQLRRAFFLQRFLTRIFSETGDRWLLKGGAALLVRLPDARYSRDIDLLHTTAAIEEALAELAAIARAPSDLDPFQFIMATPKLMTSDVAGARVKVDVYYGTTHLEQFPIDLSTELVPIGEVDYQSPTPVAAIDGLAPMPTFALYPLAQQISDKVCAMYERHNGQPSTRYHDLVDLILIVTTWSIDATTTRAALHHESARRGLTLPSVVASPAPSWTAGYARIAKDVAAVPENALDITSALHILSTCLNPLFQDSEQEGSWNPKTQHWSS